MSNAFATDEMIGTTRRRTCWQTMYRNESKNNLKFHQHYENSHLSSHISQQQQKRRFLFIKKSTSSRFDCIMGNEHKKPPKSLTNHNAFWRPGANFSLCPWEWNKKQIFKFFRWVVILSFRSRCCGVNFF